MTAEMTPEDRGICAMCHASEATTTFGAECFCERCAQFQVDCQANAVAVQARFVAFCEKQNKTEALLAVGRKKLQAETERLAQMKGCLRP